MKKISNLGVLKYLNKLLKKRIKDIDSIDFNCSKYKQIIISSTNEITYVLEQPEQIIITFNSPKTKNGRQKNIS